MVRAVEASVQCRFTSRSAAATATPGVEQYSHAAATAASAARANARRLQWPPASASWLDD